MAHESFEDADTAAVMNDLFVNVKVDREERPDVDAVYMEAVQAMTGQRRLADDGVPHARRPAVLRRHLLPARARHGLPSFTELLQAVDEAWRERRDEVLGQADQLSDAILARTQTGGRGRWRRSRRRV